MSEVATREVNLRDLSLAELAAVANYEHALVQGAATEMLQHAIRAGEALNEARGKVRWGEWMQWLLDEFHGSKTNATLYRRIYLNRHLVLARGFTSIRGADQYLQAEGLGEFVSKMPGKVNSRRDEALRLKAQGYKKVEIAQLMGLHITTIYGYLRPDAVEKRRRVNRRHREMRAALQRENRNKAARAVGGDVSNAYSLIRRLAQVLEGAALSEENGEAKKALASALSRTYAAEDELIRALGISHPSKAKGLFVVSARHSRGRV